MPVKDIMKRDLVTITPETTTLEAIELMSQNRLPVLPVVKNEKLVGVITEADFMPISRQLIQEKLKEAEVD